MSYFNILGLQIKLTLMKQIFFFCFLGILAASFKPCQPFGTRLFYGQIISNLQSQEKLQIHFNTASRCAETQVLLLTKSGQKTMTCTITDLKLSPDTNNYQTFIHKCSSNEITFEQEFLYNVYGWDGVSDKIPFSLKPIPVKLADISNPLRKISVIILADWSHLDINANRYIKLDNLFNKITQEKEINALVINGDIGYDLDTNNCSNYQSFILMLSQIAQKIPVVMITGNREYNTRDNYLLFQNSFQMYQLDKLFAVGLNLGALNILAFDPFEIVLNHPQAKDPMINKFTDVLNKVKYSGRYVVPISHYPLACSGKNLCLKDRAMMKSYWDAMFEAKVSMYFGAHFHTYQRLYPYYKNDTFSKDPDNYRSDKGYIISIVEAVGGNDRDIVQSIDTILPITASYTVNETGFGVLQVDSKNAKFSHYSTKQGLSDSISIAIIRSNLLSQQ